MGGKEVCGPTYLSELDTQIGTVKHFKRWEAKNYISPLICLPVAFSETEYLSHLIGLLTFSCGQPIYTTNGSRRQSHPADV